MPPPNCAKALEPHAAARRQMNKGLPNLKTDDACISNHPSQIAKQICILGRHSVANQ
jgi:hypothetical protein